MGYGFRDMIDDSFDIDDFGAELEALARQLTKVRSLAKGMTHRYATNPLCGCRALLVDDV
jgi:hypothetical protein